MHRFTRLSRMIAGISVLSMSFLLTVTAAVPQTGTVTANSLRLRSMPSTESAVLSTAAQGSLISILSNEKNGWYEVLFHDQKGFMSSEYISLCSNTGSSSSSESPSFAYIDTGSSTLNLRSGPGTSYSVLASVRGGAVLPITAVEGTWYQVDCNGTSGYVCGDYIRVLSEKEAQSMENKASVGEQIANKAQDFLGCKYVYGASGPSAFDCSGFTKYIYSKFGYHLNRTASTQLSNGVSISKTNLKPGDLVFFKSRNTSKAASHVGLYIGSGKFIHASTNNYKVCISNLSAGYYASVFTGARRLV